MKRRYVYLLLPFFLVFLLICYHRYFYEFEEPDQEALVTRPIESPDGKYKASAYYIPYGGAAGGVLYNVEVEQTGTGKKKTIYSSEHMNDFSMNWTSSEVLSIKNESPEYKEYRSTELNVATDIYQDTGEACRSLLLKGTYENCYKAEEIRVPLIFKLLGF